MELEEDKVGGILGIYKKWSGLLFDDTFDSVGIDPRYQISPANACKLDTSIHQLHMAHTSIETMVLFDIPAGEANLVCEVSADYIPTELGDEGGIVVWQDGYHRLEFLESKDTTTVEYSKWRVQKKDNQWTFYADRGYGWELFDTAPLAAAKLGAILKNPQVNGFVDLKLDRVVLCRSSQVTLGNLPADYTAYLCDANGHMIASATVLPGWTGVEFDLPTLAYHGQLKVYDNHGALLSTLDVSTMYGGDVYLYGTDLRVLWSGTELNLTGQTNLGTMYDNVIQVQMELHNPSANKAARDISMGILKYRDEFGYEWADICHDDGTDKPNGNYTQKLTMGSLDPLGKKKFWMKVERKSSHFGIKPLHFMLDIDHM
ncbi:cell adhesion protein [Paenibacillus sp. CAU 1523]|uniref:Cell adhesion protein n=1 Tax=Paenibacillus arenosi TaxID=2774142 RepID=A0ABR9AXL3_9BACL|nr:cell adhesion protein [Paenibacillus arenosi]